MTSTVRGWLWHHRAPRWILLGLGTVALLAVVAPAAFVAVACVRPGVTAAERPDDVRRVADGVSGYYRPESATYLTLPEWYIVYSTEEYAAFIEEHPPSAFPHLGAIRQFWRIYAAVCAATRSAYPFDPGTHLMLAVIGMSFTAENAIKGLYESTLGRLSEWIGGHHTDEDAFAYRTARAYGAFMHTVPWYEFPFAGRLSALWQDTSLWGPAPLRKCERKVVLSAEYGVKAAYGWLIRQGTGAVYVAEDQQIHARVAGDAAGDPRLRKVKDVAPDSAVVILPRYEPFTNIVIALARRGTRFLDIAGNDVIVLTALTPRSRRRSADLLFAEPILTDPTTERIAVRAPVRSLHVIVPALEAEGARIEHLYDY